MCVCVCVCVCVSGGGVLCVCGNGYEPWLRIRKATLPIELEH